MVSRQLQPQPDYVPPLQPEQGELPEGNEEEDGGFVAMPRSLSKMFMGGSRAFVSGTLFYVNAKHTNLENQLRVHCAGTNKTCAADAVTNGLKAMGDTDITQKEIREELPPGKRSLCEIRACVDKYGVELGWIGRRNEDKQYFYGQGGGPEATLIR